MARTTIATLESWPRIAELRQKAADLGRERDRLKRRLAELAIGAEGELEELAQKRIGLIDAVARLREDLAAIQAAHADRQWRLGADTRTGLEPQFDKKRGELKRVKGELADIAQRIQRAKVARARREMDPAVAALVGDEDVAAAGRQKAEREAEREKIEGELPAIEKALAELDRRQQELVGEAKAAVKPAFEESYEAIMGRMAEALAQLRDVVSEEEAFCGRLLGYGIKAGDLVKRVPFLGARQACLAPGRGIAYGTDPGGAIDQWFQAARGLDYPV